MLERDGRVKAAMVQYIPGTKPMRSCAPDILLVENRRRDREVDCDRGAKRKVWRVRSMANG
jgi:hypothetical protein